MTEKEIFLYALRRVVQNKYAKNIYPNDLPFANYESYEKDFFWTDEKGNVLVQGDDYDEIIVFKFGDHGNLIDFD